VWGEEKANEKDETWYLEAPTSWGQKPKNRGSPRSNTSHGKAWTRLGLPQGKMGDQRNNFGDVKVKLKSCNLNEGQKEMGKTDGGLKSPDQFKRGMTQNSF